ncbi:MAG: hypothetical protein HY821_04400 [Acidobacteria bacterium]|nr:hypothetical protein [Acidobacteriota bacterium]
MLKIKLRKGCVCCWLLAGAAGAVRAQSAGEASASTGDTPAASYIKPIEPVRLSPWWIKPNSKKGVDWKGLAWQSGIFLSAQHAFRLATEPGTREELKGKFFPDYADTLGSLHGWSDGDPFYVNYVGHPMQGAVSAYIWTHNDRDYIGVQFGKNSEYWKSRARAAAFAWTYSVLFEIGPVSEATIGNVQKVYPQQGFVDHVVTPFLGMGWMFAEDALDRYVIQRFEGRFENPVARVFVRGFLNPSRSWANVMRLKVPWARDDRPGAFSPLLKPYLADQRAGRIRQPEIARKEIEGEFGLSKFEISMNFRPYFWLSSATNGPCLGGSGEGAFRVANSWQFVVDAGGCKLTGLDKNISGDVLTYAAGPRWSPRGTNRWNPYAHLLLGGMQVREEKVDPILRDLLTATAAAEKRDAAADYARYAEAWDANSFAITAGTGLNLRLHPAFALKLADLEYRRAWLPAINGRNYNNSLSFTVGATLRMGTW